MALANAVQGARYIAQQITWTDEDGTAVDLTGATLTGRLKNLTSKVVSNIDGALALVTPASGIFSWTYGANDVGTAGSFQVQFIATFGGGLSEKTLLEEWTVHAAI